MDFLPLHVTDNDYVLFSLVNKEATTKPIYELRVILSENMYIFLQYFDTYLLTNVKVNYLRVMFQLCTYAQTHHKERFA